MLSVLGRSSVPVFLLLTVAGCGGDGAVDVPVVPVSGQITYEGEAIEDASVVLHPLSPTDPKKPKIVPRAKVDKTGAFQLSTFRANDGAPPGKYIVTVSWLGPLEGVHEDDEDDLPELLPSRYQDPRRSGLQIEIADGENAPLQLALTN